MTHPRFHAMEPGEEADLFGGIASADILVHHPYDSFANSVQRFIETAAADPAVLALKQTLYRTSAESPNMRALIRAAEDRKQVAVTVEIKARFDEAANIEWAERLEKVGAHVAYGVVGSRRTPRSPWSCARRSDGLRCYTHIATGNYNPETAKLYTDLGLFTCREEIAEDVVQLFNMLTGYVHQPQFKKLLVAPINMRQRFLELIEREVEHQKAGRGGTSIAKMNALEDRQIIEALYEASAAGVEMDLIVRGICRLRPGLPGRSETIRVISIVGRFLEHARIFYFAQRGASRSTSSARRTGWRATSTPGWRRSRRSRTRGSRRSSRRSSTCSSPTTSRPGTCAPTAATSSAAPPTARSRAPARIS